jgi:hypothetical protein
MQPFEVMRTVRALIAVSAVLLVGCPARDEAPPPARQVTRVELSEGRVLLWPGHLTAPLVARAFDADGVELAGATLTWTSSDERVATVDATGTVRAVGPIGSAVVVASAGDVSSNGALVVVAKPVAGAVVLDDAQVSDPVAVDPIEAFDLGWKFRVTLEGVPAPPAGAVLMTSGDKPVGGRVVSSVTTAQGVDVLLEVMPLDDAFDELVMKARVPLALPPAAASTGQQLRQGLTRVGPFECQTTLEPTLISVSLPQLTYTPRMDTVVDYDRMRPLGDRFRELRFQGELAVDLVASVTIGAAGSAELECAVEVGAFPVAGLPFLLGVHIPVGIGMSLSLGGSYASAGGQLHLSGKYAVDEGFTCPQGPDSCVMVHGSSSGLNGTLEPVLQTSADGVRVEFATFGFASAKLSLGTALKRLRFDALEAKAGLHAVLDTAPRQRQVAEKDYHSGVTLSLHAEAEAASAFERLKKMLQLKLLNVTATADVVLAHVPEGTLTAWPTSLEPGGTTTLTVDLAAHTAEAARRVELVRVDGTSMTTVCSLRQASSAQSRYRCQLTLPNAGRHVFFAFVDDAADGSGLTFELGDNAPAVVQVGPDFGSLKRVSMRLGPLSGTLRSAGTNCDPDQTLSGSMTFLHGENGSWSGDVWTATWDRQYPAGSFGGHRRETATWTLTFDPTRSLLVGLHGTHVVVGYADDPQNNTTREETSLRWLGPSIPTSTPLVGTVDFTTDVPLTPAVLQLARTRTVTWNDCVETLTSWRATDPSLTRMIVGLSP